MNPDGRFTTPRGGRTLPLGKLVCVGRNYSAHAREMGVAPPEEPFFFLKPSTSFLPSPRVVALPPFSAEVHHEVELVVRVGSALRRGTVEQAGAAIDAVAVGIDLTARDVQAKAKAAGLPWTIAKGFDGAAPVGEFVAIPGAVALGDRGLSLRVNGQVRQQAQISTMLRSAADLLAWLSARMTLEAGDLLFTGTPAGVGPLVDGDQIVAELEGAPRLEFCVTRELPPLS
jgi:2-keto-4-pentenoate hydratase/2-oxohepta-3-ene-1,7-dioic acid hydratase in catechol pathway